MAQRYRQPIAVNPALAAGPEHAWPGLARVLGTHPWHDPCGDCPMVPPVALAQGRLHMASRRQDRRDRGGLPLRVTLESAGDKDACATCQCPKGRCTLRVLAVPCLPSSTFHRGAERHAPVQQRKGAAAHPSILPSHGRHAWNARGSLITDIHVRPTAPQQAAHVPMRRADSLARGNPSRIGENSHE